MPQPLNEPLPSALVSPEAGRWVRRAWCLIAGLALWRLLWLWILPLDLVADEAYYWDWGRRPDWGFFSKPPMIGWINTLTQALGLNFTAGVRVPAMVLGTVTMTMLWLLARRWWGERVGFMALVLVATAPGALATNSMMTTDAPLLASWAVALYALWRALEPSGAPVQAPTLDAGAAASTAAGRSGRAGWWGLYGLAGILGVWSKQMMLVLPLLALLFILTRPGGGGVRALRWSHVGLLVPLLALGPLTWWNWRHDWITVQHTAHHFSVQPRTLAEVLTDAGGFLASQFGLVGPVTLVLFLGAAAAWRWARADAVRWFCWLMSVPAMAVVALLSFRQEVLPNWPGVFQLSAILLATAWLATEWPRRARTWGWAWRVGTVGLVLGYSAVLAITPLGLQGSKLDITKRLRGWAEAGQRIGEWQARVEAEGGPVIVVVSGRRKVASELAFYLPGQPRVWRWTPPGVVDSQYALWPGPLPEHRGGRALIVMSDGEAAPPEGLTQGFKRVRKLGEVVMPPKTDVPQRLQLWLGEDLQSWDHGKPLRE